jgi:hypothetical protein
MMVRSFRHVTARLYRDVDEDAWLPASECLWPTPQSPSARDAAEVTPPFSVE